MSEGIELLQTGRLQLRSWQESDRDLFREINADADVMRYFPHRRSAEEADKLMDDINSIIHATGFGAYALALKQTNQPIGFCGLMQANMPGIFPEGTVEIGWRLAPRFWRHGYVSEAATAMLDHAFDVKKLDAVVSFAVPENTRSIAVMERLHLKRIQALDFDHPRVPDTAAHLKRHIVYAITKDAWRARRQAS